MSARAYLPAALALALSAAAGAGGCGSNPAATSSSSSGGPTTSGSSSSGTPEAQHVWTECQASDQAWVRRALLGLNGRRSWGQAEVNAYEDAVKALRAASAGSPPPVPGADLEDARRLVAQAIMGEDAFRERWSDFLLDALHVNRIELKSQQDCYGPPNPSAIDDGSLAASVRDGDPGSSKGSLHDFTMGQLLSSALQLDDLSVVYRGNLFAMMHHPIDGANVDFLAMERIRRQDFGAVFGSAYVHRDLVCLSCHNSEFSVTFNQDPALNRAWAVPGLFELSLYGASNGKHPAAEAATKGSDELRAVSMLRFTDVVDDNAAKPWGWADACGRFAEPMSDDPLAIDAYFGSVRSTADAPGKGLRASIWDVERALHRGVDLLAAHGLRRGAMGELADPDEAFAYLVAENLVEKVWNEVVGHPLTIANYFPRTEVQRDILMALTEHFVATHFSLKALLLDIVAHPAFNLKAPDEGCGVAPYEVPNIFDPWTTSDGDLARRGNSPADGVFAVSSRPLLRSLHRAMQWPYVEEYPQDESFQVALGVFIKDGDPGFRGLDFQGRLTWEDTYGSCVDQSGADFVDAIVAQAGATPGATVGAAIIALKDRLLGEPAIDAAEKTDLEALVGGSLDATDLTGLDQKLRAVCGVLVSTPAFMLGGIPPADTRVVPALTPPAISYAGTCGYVAQYVTASAAPYTVTCGAGTTTATHK
jgi:hypothetical protein